MSTQGENHEALSATPGATTETPEVTFEQQVNNLAAQMVQKEDGLWHLPDGVETTPEVKFAATLEKRRRDTESKLGKTSQSLKAKETETAELRKLVQAKVRTELSPEDATRLQELKFSDPDAWRTEMGKLETKAASTLEEDFGKISTVASQQAELERRTQLLNEYNRLNPGHALNDEVLANDIPPRIVKKLETGDSSFEEFLAEASAYLKAGKVVAAPKVEDEPNLNAVGGTSVPAASAVDGNIVESYKKTVF